MDYIIGCDAHKHYSQFAVLEEDHTRCKQVRVEHERGAIREFLSEYPEGTPVALESIGNWYWIVEEIEQAGCQALLAHPAKAKAMMGNVNKTDKLDARGLAMLLRNGTLPTVWIAPSEVRDERELPRTQMALCKIRVALKNRVHATLAKYNLSLPTESDIFAPKWSSQLNQVIEQLPVETKNCLQQEMQLLKTVPGVGDILAIVIGTEIGLIERFASAEQLASYAGTVPAVKSSGGKVRYCHTPKESNHYLKWAFVEAANGPAQYHKHPHWQHRHVTRLYERVRLRKGHSVAVARHLAEATFWILNKKEPYREPTRQKVLPRQA